MSKQKIVLETKSGTVLLHVMVQPRASRNEIIGAHGDHLKVRLTSPPVEGAANRDLIKLLSKKLKVAANKLEIRKGHRGRQKVVEIKDCKLIDVKSKLGLQ